MRKEEITKLVKNYFSKLVAKNKVKEKIIELDLVHDFYGMVHHATKIIYRRFSRLTILDIEKYVQREFNDFIKIYNIM